MKFQRRFALVFAALALAGVSAQADTGFQQASTTIHLAAFVPVICHVDLAGSAGASEGGVTPVGQVSEFCNAPRGYRVMIETASGLENAAVIRDGVRIPISASGETVLTDASHPDISRLSLAVDPGSAPERFTSLGVRIEAKV